MLIKEMLKQQQAEVHRRLKVRTVSESFKKSDYENMMKHSSYKRTRGGIRQVR
ncbi:hypothetical protein [uncultured Clostridium sp.]|jgi:hypothetical protein|uniref:hypothetical protein n=1 Tax=uncultured Clostridium sp. TaxID=59620 RepID=UPI002621AEBA|nr:hypothetical protein [uncultured Clostridium sp.]